MEKIIKEKILIPVYISLEAEVVIYRDILNNCFVYERVGDNYKERGSIKLN